MNIQPVISNKRSELLNAMWQTAIAAVNGRTVVNNYLSNLNSNYEYVIAIGKAASDMSLGVFDLVEERINQALVITKYGHANSKLSENNKTQVIESGHPIPDHNSLVAGKTLLEFIEKIPPGEKLLLLISGGASALVEVLPKEYSLEKWQSLNQQIIASGKDIAEINSIRKSISMIKGGKLNHFIGAIPTLVLLISDVPEDKLNVIGSGLVSPTSNIQMQIIANNKTACKAAVELAKEHGYPVMWQQKILEGDINAVASDLSQQILTGPEGVYVWGGETTVRLPQNPGKGGRNQALALLLVEKVAGNNITILAAGTDGTDGPTDAAGGLIDGGTLSKGQSLELDISKYQNEANAYPYLDATDSLFKVGPTGTNVMDVIFAVKGGAV